MHIFRQRQKSLLSNGPYQPCWQCTKQDSYKRNFTLHFVTYYSHLLFTVCFFWYFVTYHLLQYICCLPVAIQFVQSSRERCIPQICFVVLSLVAPCVIFVLLCSPNLIKLTGDSPPFPMKNKLIKLTSDSSPYK